MRSESEDRGHRLQKDFSLIVCRDVGSKARRPRMSHFAKSRFTLAATGQFQGKIEPDRVALLGQVPNDCGADHEAVQKRSVLLSKLCPPVVQ